VNLNWFGDIEETKWLHYIRLCLRGTLRVVELLQHHSVLVHCSHGWDRTSQLSALAQLCLDPYYRTYRGFQVLIEKDFIAFGHPFQTRLANGEAPDTEFSPIFLQVLVDPSNGLTDVCVCVFVVSLTSFWIASGSSCKSIHPISSNTQHHEAHSMYSCVLSMDP
jgi:hypothetical protein